MNVLGVTVCVAIALTVCLPEVASKGQLGEICNQDWECQIFGSACVDGYCMCKPTHDEFNGLCVIEFGKRCTQTLDICKGTNVTCRYAEEWEGGEWPTCMCLLNYTLHITPDICRKRIAMPCNLTKTDECNDGSCVESECRGGLCVGDTCTGNNGTQCEAGDEEGTCLSGKCMVDTCKQSTQICPKIGTCNCTAPGLVPTKNRVRCFPDLDKPCTERCADTNAECKNKVCSCKATYQKGKSLFWKQECKKSLGMACYTGEDCAAEGATCIPISLTGKDKVCVCGPGYVAKQDRSDCLEAAGDGSPCEEDLQCQVKLGIHSECKEDGPVKKKCACKAKYEFDEDDGICVRA